MPSSRGGSLSIGLIGIGLVGGALLRQISESPLRDHLSIVALATSKKMLLSPSVSLGPEKASALQQDKDAVATDIEALAKFVLKSAQEKEGVKAVIVDCTATEALGKFYPTWMSQGISIVTPNKKAFSGDLALFQSVSGIAFFFFWM